MLTLTLQVKQKRPEPSWQDLPELASLPPLDSCLVALIFLDLKVPGFPLIPAHFLRVGFGPGLLSGEGVLDPKSAGSESLVLSRFG